MTWLNRYAERTNTKEYKGCVSRVTNTRVESGLNKIKKTLSNALNV